jgi:hypothetical protein
MAPACETPLHACLLGVGDVGDGRAALLHPAEDVAAAHDARALAPEELELPAPRRLFQGAGRRAGEATGVE